MVNRLQKTFEYDFEQGAIPSNMNNRLFCTFCIEEDIPSTLSTIKSTYTIQYNKIFILDCRDSEEYLCTYNVDLGNVSGFLPETILVHRKKETRTLYTINALNILIKQLNGGRLDSTYPIEWDNYRDSALLTRDGELKVLKTSLFQIEQL